MNRMAKRFEKWLAPQIEHGKMTVYNWLVLYPEGLVLGARSDIGAFTFIQARYGVEIGDDAEIGSHCAIYSHSSIDGKMGKVTIGQGAMIGSHTTIMPNISIGENAIIGAHSLVLHDIAADTIAFGVPARHIRMR
jgi:acetyltransferase-like isoleucine patch superfamily enzyme